MAWFRRFLGKKVTINGCQDTYYQGRLVACLNGRVFLKDVYVCHENKRTQIPLLALETKKVCCLYVKDEDQTLAINIRAVG